MLLNYKTERLFKGKSDTSKYLLCHLFETAAMAKQQLTSGVLRPSKDVLAAKMNIPEEELISFICFLCASHDIGKYHPVFQENIGNEDALLWLPEDERRLYGTDSSFRHEEYGADAIKRWISGHKLENRFGYIEDYLCVPIYLHHQKHKSGIRSVDTPALTAKTNEVLDYLYELFPFDMDRINSCRSSNGVLLLLEGIVITCDWMASTKNVFDDSVPEHFESFSGYFLHLENQARRFITQNLMEDICVKTDTKKILSDKNPYKSLFGIDSPRPMQMKIAEIMKGLNGKPAFVLIDGGLYSIGAPALKKHPFRKIAGEERLLPHYETRKETYKTCNVRLVPEETAEKIQTRMSIEEMKNILDTYSINNVPEKLTEGFDPIEAGGWLEDYKVFVTGKDGRVYSTGREEREMCIHDKIGLCIDNVLTINRADFSHPLQVVR